MDIMLAIMVMLTLGFYLYHRNSGWQTMLVGTGPEAEELEAKYAYLRDHQVKCRLRTVNPAGLGAIHTAASAIDACHLTKKLEVREQHQELAGELLMQFEREQRKQTFGV